jgi:hypothetical protein
MIVLGGSNAHGNLLHIVLGPESSFWMGLHGAVLSNITPVLNAMDPSLPVFVHVSRCESEAQLAEIISAQAAMNNPYPFQVPTNVFVPKNLAQQKLPGAPAQPQVKPAADPTKTQTQSQPVAVPVVPKGRCARCGGLRKELVPKVDPTICYDCLHLDLMLAASRRSPPVAVEPEEPRDEQPDQPDQPAQ